MRVKLTGHGFIPRDMGPNSESIFLIRCSYTFFISQFCGSCPSSHVTATSAPPHMPYRQKRPLPYKQKRPLPYKQKRPLKCHANSFNLQMNGRSTYRSNCKLGVKVEGSKGAIGLWGLKLHNHDT